jgi:hypothetical protein
MREYPRCERDVLPELGQKGTRDGRHAHVVTGYTPNTPQAPINVWAALGSLDL